MNPRRFPLATSFLFLSSLLTLLAGVEGGLAFFLSFPRFVPAGALHTLVRDVYLNADRHTAQFEPQIARYDSELFYTLKPGAGQFKNREFSVRMEINSLGVRDDEATLKQPELIAVGDSFTMGWGIEAKQTFPKLLEAKLGKRVLNAGISSYGTVRERRLLDRFDTSKVNYFVLQYCDNDYPENKAFFENGNRLPVHPQAFYQETVAQQNQTFHYYPGKYTGEIFSFFLDRLKVRFGSPSPTPRVANLSPETAFLNAVLNAGKADITKAQWIVFHIEGFPRTDDSFLNRLRKEITAHRYPAFVKKMKLVDVSRDFSSKDFFVLDDHLNERGHAKLAERLFREIRPLAN